MNKKQMIEKIKKAARKVAKFRKDARFQQTMTLLTRKGLLRANQEFKQYQPRLKVEDAIWAGVHVEPRIIEVLPAALLHFPKSFVGLENLPAELVHILDLIRQDAEDGPEFLGIEFKKMKFWANSRLQDRRTKPSHEIRKTRTFRLRPEALNKLNQLVSSGEYKSQSHALEAALENL